MVWRRLLVIANQRVRPEVAGPMTGSAKQSKPARMDCFVALLLAMTILTRFPSGTDAVGVKRANAGAADSV